MVNTQLELYKSYIRVPVEIKVFNDDKSLKSITLVSDEDKKKCTNKNHLYIQYIIYKSKLKFHFSGGRLI